MNDYDQEEQEIINAFEAGKLKSQRPSHGLLSGAPQLCQEHDE